jgi:hypothetical protein
MTGPAGRLPTDLFKARFPRPWFQDRLFGAVIQPLLDRGWRIDYERVGLTRPDADFLPLDQLKKALEGLGPAGRGDDAVMVPRLPAGSGERRLTFEDLYHAVCALEPDFDPDEGETALFPQRANSSVRHGGTPMHEHLLEVGEELVIGGDITLTLLAVEAGEVLLGITAPEPGDVAGAPPPPPRPGPRQVPPAQEGRGAEPPNP